MHSTIEAPSQRQQKRLLETAAQKDIQQLLATTASINKRLGRLSSLRFRFFSGIVQGFGVVIGGTLVAYVLITLLLETLRQVNYIPLINGIFESEYFTFIVGRLLRLQTELL